MSVVRLWERNGKLTVLEQSAAELARARAAGGRVFDVTVGAPSRAAAEKLLNDSRQIVDEAKDPAEFDRVQRLKRRVVEVI